LEVPEKFDALDIVEMVRTRLCFGGGVQVVGSSTDILSMESKDTLTVVESVFDAQLHFFDLHFFLRPNTKGKHPVTM
jgi:hypothetical protein